MPRELLAAAGAAPARGAPLSDIVPAIIVGAVAVLVLIAVAAGHLRGSLALTRRLCAVSENQGLPGWAGVPVAIATGALLIAAFGFYWDVSWHIDRGRDPGPFANPAHWFIIVGLAGIALAGILSIVLGDEVETGSSIRLTDRWHIPVGGALLTLCGVLALAGFPLDDAWHRIFGQDVTLWGPTHIQMIGGASLSTLAMWMLLEEGLRARPDATRSGVIGWIQEHREIPVGGAFLIGMSTLQGEFDYGVPQFRQLYHPILIMLAAAIALVAVRTRGPRWSAVGAVAFFLAVRSVLTLLIGPVLGRSTLHFPLYIVEALVIEAVAARVGRGRQITIGLWSGIGIGTVGLAAEWRWTHIWSPLPWHASLLPEAALFGFAAAVAGGVIGGLIGRCLAPLDEPRQPTPRLAAAAAWAVALVCVAYPLPMTASPHVTADASLTEVAAGLGRHVRLDVRLTPPDAARGADWFTVTAWQGERNGSGGLVVTPLEQVQPGVYSTRQPVPVSGEWKALLRLEKDRQLVSLPIFMPDDPAIPASEIPASVRITRSFVRDKSVLQREAVGGTPGLQRGAYALLGLMGIAWISWLSWGLRRFDRAALAVGAVAGPGAADVTNSGTVLEIHTVKQ